MGKTGIGVVCGVIVGCVMAALSELRNKKIEEQTRAIQKDIHNMAVDLVGDMNKELMEGKK